jgi:hypothetical protein
MLTLNSCQAIHDWSEKGTWRFTSTHFFLPRHKTGKTTIIYTGKSNQLSSSESESESEFKTGRLPPMSSSWRQARWDSRTVFFQLYIYRSPYVTSSLTRGCVYRLQLLLVLASAVILRSESRGTQDQILLSQIRDSPNLEGQVPVFMSPRNRVARLYPQALGSLFVASYDSRGIVI